MRRLSIGNKLINKANHMKNELKEFKESILVMGFGQIFISLLIEQSRACMKE